MNSLNPIPSGLGPLSKKLRAYLIPIHDSPSYSGASTYSIGGMRGAQKLRCNLRLGVIKLGKVSGGPRKETKIMLTSDY